MTLRHLLSWKTLFYEGMLPALRRLGPSWGDATLGGVGRLGLAWPPYRRTLAGSIARARAALGADWDPDAATVALAASIPRFLARDYPLEGAPDAEVFARFDVSGFEHVDAAFASGRGAILLGSHLGGHLAALHWLYRRGVPMRLLVQRPRHVSATLHTRFDRDDPPHPQSGFFLRRTLPPGAAAERMLRARAALRDNLAVYLTGDIPWTGPNARPGRLLGHARTFLSVWTDLALLAPAPVIPVFCTHRPAGRFALTFEPPWTVTPGSEDALVARYLARLESVILAHPAEAVPHLTWPCYVNPPEPKAPAPHLALARSAANAPASKCQMANDK